MAIGARGGSNFSLQGILNRVFRCSHRHQGRPITPRGGGQAYAVCLDCGTRLAYDLNAIRVDAAVPEANVDRQSCEVGKEKVLDIPAQGLIRGATRRWVTTWNDSSLFHRGFGTTAVLWIGVISLAAGLLYLPNRPEGPKKRTTPEKARSSLPADTVKSSPSMLIEPRSTEGVVSPPTKLVGNRTVSKQPKSHRGRETVGPDSTSRAAPLGSNQVLRLESKKSVIVLGREAVAAIELSQHPGSLRKLIRNGSLFTVRRGTAIKLLEENRLVSKVLITEGSMLGQEGWAPTWQVSP